MARPQALCVAAGPDRADPAVPGVRPGAGDGAGRLLVLRPVLGVRDLPRARPGDRDGRDQPARQRDQVAGTGSLLPLVHIRVPADPVRRPGVRVLAVVERQTLDARRRRADVDRGDGERDRDQHRARARPQAREHGAVAEQGGARAERVRALLHRAQPRPPRARGHPRGPGERAAGGELLRLPAAHRGRKPALRLGARAHAPGRAGAARRGLPATTSSARGR